MQRDPSTGERIGAFGHRLGDEQARPRVADRVLRVLGHEADEEERVAAIVEAEARDRAVRVPRGLGGDASRVRRGSPTRRACGTVRRATARAAAAPQPSVRRGTALVAGGNLSGRWVVRSCGQAKRSSSLLTFPANLDGDPASLRSLAVKLARRSLLSLFVFALALDACGGDGSPSAQVKSPATTSAPATTTTRPAPTTTTVPAYISYIAAVRPEVTNIGVFPTPETPEPSRQFPNPWLYEAGNPASAVPQVFLVESRAPTVGCRCSCRCVRTAASGGCT